MTEGPDTTADAPEQDDTSSQPSGYVPPEDREPHTLPGESKYDTLPVDREVRDPQTGQTRTETVHLPVNSGGDPVAIV